MPHGSWYLVTVDRKHPGLNHRPPMMSHIQLHQSASESCWISGVLIFAALVYLGGWLRIRRHGHNERRRAGSFAIGLLFIWIATASPLATLDHEMLTAHMVQHLLLMTLAPPLILFGRPRKPLAHGLPRRWLEAIGRPLRSQSMK